MNDIAILITKFIDIAQSLELPERDVNNAKDFLKHREYGLAFDTILVQMYEYDIEIDNEFYNLITKISKKMNIDEADYVIMKELIRTDDIIPKSVKERLAELLALIESSKVL